MSRLAGLLRCLLTPPGWIPLHVLEGCEFCEEPALSSFVLSPALKMYKQHYGWAVLLKLPILASAQPAAAPSGELGHGPLTYLYIYRLPDVLPRKGKIWSYNLQGAIAVLQTVKSRIIPKLKNYLSIFSRQVTLADADMLHHSLKTKKKPHSKLTWGLS